MKAFAENNFFKLNVSKCEIMLFCRDRNPTCEVDGSQQERLASALITVEG